MVNTCDVRSSLGSTQAFFYIFHTEGSGRDLDPSRKIVRIFSIFKSKCVYKKFGCLPDICTERPEDRSDWDRPTQKSRAKFVRTIGEPPPLFSGVL